ncbi:DNA-directed primase/polymerase protein isoform X2 [Rhineura floridana]|uniref:DNA-directed primase/polymerase protein isoform X2 n=1 Tax=Rhineura floridana TaxID=261503 RepID=UPI002AC8321E|nr:DNA-directed primase/polymerase protein isoform X2 [Rhineura floridana]XP_061439824.1 DNA-directed primase/polymerase protein isoform X2 [Rhineura floridana]XP_061439825.1 DNA-directed primase/polymerase protein isoform X2 [Rhineura floridana]XP_061439826.1 DNA-directed primase/polymerase protein isoform X2 [Rhineura floridana]
MNTRQTKRKWEERLRDVRELASWYKRRPLCVRYKPQLSKPWQPSSIWKLFHRQTQAFNYAKTCKEDVHVFALEKNTENKQRFYLVTTYTELWFYYSKHCETSLMHCYEVIPEEAVCKLYFDLEFYIPANQGADGNQMVADLIEFVCKKIDERYGIKCSVEDILNLDSSTDEKFSCHLIFQLHDAAFKNNIHIGNFLRTIFQPGALLTKSRDAMVREKQMVSLSQCCKATIDLPSLFENQTVTKDVSQSWKLSSQKALENGQLQWKENPDLSFLIVTGKQGAKQLFVDLGVYTKNRNFRLYKSSKAGSSVVLDIAEDNRFVPKPVKNSCIEEQYFLSSLICDVRFSDSLKILSCDNPKETREKSMNLDGNVSKSCPDPIGGYHCSPYPEIDNFVLSLVSKDGVQGEIRRWSYFSLEQLLVYDISKYRWCRNIDRAHKSNNIMIVIDLKSENWYQKCHDPICRAENFKSECFPLPAEICLPFLFKEDEEYVYIMDENGNIEEKANVYHGLAGLSDRKSLTAAQETREPNIKKSSGVKWDDETDICFLEAVEDVELAEAADTFQPWIIDEIPDELLVDASKHKGDEIKE